MKLDPNRLFAIIKDRHVLVQRLGMALKEAKEDGKGDAFRINAILKEQLRQLSILEIELKSITPTQETIKAAILQDKKQADQAAINRIRAEIDQWIRYEL